MGRVSRHPCPQPQHAYDWFANILGTRVSAADLAADLEDRVADVMVVDLRSVREREDLIPDALLRPQISDEDIAAWSSFDGVVVLVGADHDDLRPEATAVRLAPLGIRVKTLHGGMAAWQRRSEG